MENESRSALELKEQIYYLKIYRICSLVVAVFAIKSSLIVFFNVDDDCLATAILRFNSFVILVCIAFTVGFSRKTGKVKRGIHNKTP